MWAQEVLPLSFWMSFSLQGPSESWFEAKRWDVACCSLPKEQAVAVRAAP